VLHDIGHQNGTDYLVMECVEGETLAKRLEKGPLPLDQVLKYGAQVADALDRAHRKSVVHRDLKPGNIMLTKSGAKLLDFGLATSLCEAFASDQTVSASLSERALTSEGTILGTVQYMSPEQLEGKETDARSDIFSFGVVLYEIATGQSTLTKVYQNNDLNFPGMNTYKKTGGARGAATPGCPEPRSEEQTGFHRSTSLLKPR
jgi:eukaryotic-like serine/threonine-protein kinase